MTIQIKRLLNRINKEIETNPGKKINLKKLSEEIGYSKTSRQIYRPHIKAHIVAELSKLGYTGEELRKRFELGAQLALKTGDFTNYLRATEDIAQLSGEFKKVIKSEVTITEQSKHLIDEFRLSPSEN